MKLAGLLLLAALAPACVAVSDDTTSTTGGGKADGDGSDAGTGPAPDEKCTSPSYGDGVCQVDLACNVPDIDCFVTFDTDEAAAAWEYERFPSYPTAPTTDPMYTRARSLVDRAWDLYKKDVPVGDLAQKRVGAVVVEDPTVNAFVMADGAPGMVGLSVQINAGTLTSTLTDDQIIGVLLHELTHAIRLHPVPEVADKIRRYYVAETPEQIGATAPEHAQARTAGEAWRAASWMAGTVSDPTVGALPIDGDLAQAFTQWAWTTPACVTQVSQLQGVRAEIVYDEMANGFAPTPDQQTRAATALADLVACNPTNDTRDLATLFASMGYDWQTYFATALTPEEHALDYRPARDALLQLVASHRQALRAIETGFTTATGAPWSKLRFYSIEEEADDYSARISAHLSLPEIGSIATMYVILGTERAACDQALATGSAPYGLNLYDDHHGSCWRIGHMRQVAAAAKASSSALLPAAPARAEWTPTRPVDPRPVY